MQIQLKSTLPFPFILDREMSQIVHNSFSQEMHRYSPDTLIPCSILFSRIWMTFTSSGNTKRLAINSSTRTSQKVPGSENSPHSKDFHKSSFYHKKNLSLMTHQGFLVKILKLQSDSSAFPVLKII